ncbi:hypothetical protein ES707_04937 [subsurface metagenome]
MTTVSTNPGTEVKPKPPAFSAHLDSDDPQLEIPPADQAVKTAQNSDLQKPGLAVPTWRLLEKPIKVPMPAGRKSRLSASMYYLLAVLNAHKGDREFCSPSIIRLALECRASERQIRRWRAKLERLKYIRIDRRGKRNRYRVIQTRNMPHFVFVDPRWVYRLGLSINEAVVLGYGYFRCNGKPETWFSIRRAAEDLGLSYNTIRRCLAVLAAWGFIEIRPGRKSGGRTNRYKPAPFGWMVSWENYPKRARPKCPVKRNTPAAQRLSCANFIRNDFARAELGLSYDYRLDQEIYKLLVKLRVNRFVAKSIAVQWRGYAKSVKQAILNAAYLFDADAETLRRHNLTRPRGTFIDYIIGTLNRAYNEGHRIKPNKLARQGEARRQVKLAIAAAGRPAGAELKKLEQYAENVLKPCLAKLHTSPKTAIPAKYKPICDKKADDEWLRAV